MRAAPYVEQEGLEAGREATPARGNACVAAQHPLVTQAPAHQHTSMEVRCLRDGIQINLHCSGFREACPRIVGICVATCTDLLRPSCR